MAIDRIIHQDYDIDADTMIIVSGIGVVMNIAMGAILHGGFCKKLNLVHHGHSHGFGGGKISVNQICMRLDSKLTLPFTGHAHSHTEHSHSHSHGSAGHNHGHSHSPETRNMNVRAALIHVIGDLVQSIGVLIAAIVIKYWVSTRIMVFRLN